MDYDSLLLFYTDFLNLTVKINQRFEAFEQSGIETPEEIKVILIDLNISSNLLIIFSDSLTIAQSFNNSATFLHKTFYIKSIYRIVYETLILFQEYEKDWFQNSIESNSVKEILAMRKRFKKEYGFNKIKEIRNKICAHYSGQFAEHLKIIIGIDMEQSLKMFYDFQALMAKISNYLTMERFPIAELQSLLEKHSEVVTQKLKKLG